MSKDFPHIEVYPLKSDLPAFVRGITQLAAEFDISTADILEVMYFESGGTLNPAIKNSIGAVGLIQFMPGTAAGLGTSTAQLQAMKGSEQLLWVRKYLLPYKGLIHSLADFYLSIFYPLALSKGVDFVFGSEAGRTRIVQVAKGNPAFNTNKDEKITKAEFLAWVKQRWPSATTKSSGNAARGLLLAAKDAKKTSKKASGGSSGATAFIVLLLALGAGAGAGYYSQQKNQKP